MSIVDTSATQRLRAAGLRPTAARVGVLQVLDTAAPGGLCSEEIYRQMLRRGMRTCLSTVYRVVNEFEAGGLLLRSWDGDRTAYYRLKSPGRQTHPPCLVWLVRPESGRMVALDEPGLHAGLLEAARRAGVALDGQVLLVHVGDMVEMAAQAAAANPGAPRHLSIRVAGLGGEAVHARSPGPADHCLEP